MVERNQPDPTDRLFPVDHKKQFNRILREQNLKFDREGNRRTLYSLRHSYISFRLLECVFRGHPAPYSDSIRHPNPNLSGI